MNAIQWNLESQLEWIGSYVWGPAMIALLVGTGLYISFRTGLIQFRGLPTALRLLFRKTPAGISTDKSRDESGGEITPFQALTSALSATVGTGNIAGVATAIASGGPGAIFWMWVTALVGMATKYATAVLAVRFRTISPAGRISGGPMVYIEKGLGLPWLGKLFAFFTIVASFGIGNMVQANSAARPLQDLLGIAPEITGPGMALLAGLVMIGGIRRIGKVAEKLVPVMAIFYVLGALFAIFLHADRIPAVFSMIFQGAFQGRAAIGGFAGVAVQEAIRYGVARGVFSNEAGLGSAPIAHAAAKTNSPVSQGLIASLGPLIDTLIICSMTAFVILASNQWITPGLDGTLPTGATLSALSFDDLLPGPGGIIVQAGIILFAFSTILGWSYYGDRSVEYLFGEKAVRVYHMIWIVLIPVGALLKLEVVWSISDIANGLMALPNLVAVIGLAGIVARDTKKFYNEGIPDDV